MSEWLRLVLDVMDDSWPYQIALVFFAGYPLVSSIMWITTSQFFRTRWEPTFTEDRKADDNTDEPASSSLKTIPVSIVIPAHNESAVIAHSLEAALWIDWPDLEIVVIDDGSTDDTVERIRPFLAHPRVRLIQKLQNEGKAMALNDALPCLNGEILVFLDADAAAEPDILHHLVPHFLHPRTGAVTGNPRVVNPDSFLARLQLLEFTSIISLLRRSQRIWGRIQTISGVVCAVRQTALIDVGGFSPDMATEDIELTWKLQKRFWDVRYEPQAKVWMNVPLTLSGLLRQRLRWAKGLAQVIHRHADVMSHWKYHRMWPIFIEGLMSISWAVCLVSMMALWGLSLWADHALQGFHPIPNLWAMAITSMCLLQLLWGIQMDRRYDPGIGRYIAYAIWYPLFYWFLMAMCTIVTLPHLFVPPRKRPVRWSTLRSGQGANA
jgi:biofilm PGA synthesis N-glycosyltransferase PgaC